MKKIFKNLGLLALTGALALQTNNVLAAETCPEGTTQYTDYYMFLAVGSANYYRSVISDDPTVKHGVYTQTDKANNVKRSKVLAQWNVPIKNMDETDWTAECEDTNSFCSAWTVVEYWQHFYDMSHNFYLKPGTPDTKNLVYREGDSNYLAHHSYSVANEDFSQIWPAADTNDEKEEIASASKTESALVKYLEEHLNDLENSEIVKNGTAYPTTVIDEVNGLGTTDIPKLTVKVRRHFYTEDKKANGFEVGKAKQNVYSPAVYAVAYCKVDDTLVYDGNGDGDEVKNVPASVTYSGCVDVATDEPTRAGYIFTGWNTEANGSGDKFGKNGDATYCLGSGTLYAQWKKIDGSYTITYDANGGKNAPAAQTGQNGSCIKISEGKPTLARSNFLGWSTDPKATEQDKKYNAGEEYCGAEGDITLYAVWNGQTGVSAHLIAFGAAALAAGAALIVAKKRDLFKQI